MQLIVCLFMGGHEISINEILYIQYINGKRKKSHRKKKSQDKKSQVKQEKKSQEKKSQEKKSQEKSHNIFFPHLLYPGRSQYVYE